MIYLFSYFFIGVLFTLILDLSLYLSKKHGESFTNSERLVVSACWVWFMYLIIKRNIGK